MEAGKGKEEDPPLKPPEGTQLSQQVDCSPMRPILEPRTNGLWKRSRSNVVQPVGYINEDVEAQSGGGALCRHAGKNEPRGGRMDLPVLTCTVPSERG